MAGRSYSGLRRSIAVVVCVVGTAAVLTGPPLAGKALGRPWRVLQLNLCDSGIASCYTGRSVTEAAAVIRADAPDVVTLNEVCRDDVDALHQTLTSIYPNGVVQAFRAAPDRRTGGATRCRNGQPYGIGLLVHLPARNHGYATYGGTYPSQDTGDPEERVWLCVHAIAGFYACTTHLAATSATVALAQCGYLMGTAIPAMRRQSGYEPTVLGGDLNLSYGGSPDLRSCLPSGYLREGDGAVQQILATTDFTVSSSRSIDMYGTTDHPGLLVALTITTALPSKALPNTALPSPAGPRRPDHVVVAVFENKSSAQIAGQSAAPYLNALIGRAATFPDAHGVAHPSQPNYLALFSGSTQGVTDDHCPVRLHDTANLGRQLLDAGLSFTGYSEDLPAPGYPGCATDGYAAKHNPWVDFDNVPAAANQPYPAWPADFTQLPTVAFVVPNLCHDTHDCPVATGDTWARTHLDPYLRWADTHNSLLIVTFDENDDSPGNQICTLIAGAGIRPGTRSGRIDHYTILRTIEDLYGLSPIGAAAQAMPVTDQLRLAATR